MDITMICTRCGTAFDGQPGFFKRDNEGNPTDHCPYCGYELEEAIDCADCGEPILPECLIDGVCYSCALEAGNDEFAKLSQCFSYCECNGECSAKINWCMWRQWK